MHDAHISRQQSNGNNQRRRGIKRKTTSLTDSSISAQHDYHHTQFSIAFIHRSRYSLKHGSEYKVHWTNFPDCQQDDTWETEDTLQEDCPQILQEYKDNL